MAPLYFQYETDTERSRLISLELKNNFLREAVKDGQSLIPLNHVSFEFYRIEMIWKYFENFVIFCSFLLMESLAMEYIALSSWRAHIRRFSTTRTVTLAATVTHIIQATSHMEQFTMMTCWFSSMFPLWSQLSVLATRKVHRLNESHEFGRTLQRRGKI